MSTTEFNLLQVHNLVENYLETGAEIPPAVQNLKDILDALPYFLGRIHPVNYIEIDLKDDNGVPIHTYSGVVAKTTDTEDNVTGLSTLDLQSDTAAALFNSMLQVPEGAAGIFHLSKLNLYYVDSTSGFKIKIVQPSNNSFDVIFSSNPTDKIQNVLGALTLVYNKTGGRDALTNELIKGVQSDFNDSIDYFADNFEASDDPDSINAFGQYMTDYANSLFDDEGVFENDISTSPEALEAFSADVRNIVEQAEIKNIELLNEIPESEQQILLNNSNDLFSTIFSYIPDSGIADEVVKTIRKINALLLTIEQFEQQIGVLVAAIQNESDFDNKKTTVETDLFPLILERDCLANAYLKSIRHMWNIVELSTHLVPFFPNVLWSKNNIFKIPTGGVSNTELLVAAPILEMSDGKYLNPTLLGQALTTNVDKIKYVNLYSDHIHLSTEDELGLLLSESIFEYVNLLQEQSAQVDELVKDFMRKRTGRLQLQDAFTPSTIKDSDVLTAIASVSALNGYGLGNTPADLDALAEGIASKVFVKAEAKAVAGAGAKAAGKIGLKTVFQVVTAVGMVGTIALIWGFAKAISIFIDSVCKDNNNFIMKNLCSLVLKPIQSVADTVAETIEVGVEQAIKASVRIIKEVTPDSLKLALKIGIFGAVAIGLYALYKRLMPADTAIAQEPLLPPPPPALPLHTTEPAIPTTEFEVVDEEVDDSSPEDWVEVSDDTDILIPSDSTSDSALRTNAVRRRYR